MLSCICLQTRLALLLVPVSRQAGSSNKTDLAAQPSRLRVSVMLRLLAEEPRAGRLPDCAHSSDPNRLVDRWFRFAFCAMDAIIRSSSALAGCWCCCIWAPERRPVDGGWLGAGPSLPKSEVRCDCEWREMDGRTCSSWPNIEVGWTLRLLYWAREGAGGR